jgi:hypothetical protein
MSKRCFILFLLSAALLLRAFPTYSAQQDLSTKEIIEKSLLAAGGKAKIAQIKNYSFKAAGKTHYFSSEGMMKIISGTDPVITDTILISGQEVRRNCYNNLTDLEGLLKQTYIVLAKLRSGLFTLANFEGQVNSEGLKKYGPKTFHKLSTQEGDLTAEFYLDALDFSLKRVVLKGYDPEHGNYEVNHDYGPLQDLNGIKIPDSWFNSQVGTRGSLIRVTDVQINRDLAADFFNKNEVNVGDVRAAKGALSGSITEHRIQRNRLTIGTNWTDDCILKAEFQAGDKLLLLLFDKEIEVDFYTSQPPREASAAGARMMAPSRVSENYVIYLIGPEFKELAERIDLLSPIQVKLK